MYVQIIEGTTSDADGLDRQAHRWKDEVGPGAIGFLGVTSGVTADGHAITVARFESEAAAAANSQRPEQSAWWAETEKYYDGDVTFAETTDVQEFMGGGSNDSLFVQVIKTTGIDRATVDKMDAVFLEHAHLRPDLLGSMRYWTGPTTCIELAYFTNEAEARVGEQVEMPEEVREAMSVLSEHEGTTEFLDLLEPYLL